VSDLRTTFHAVPARGEHGETPTAYTGAMKRPNRAYKGPADGEAAKGGHMRGGHRLGASLETRSAKILRLAPRRCQTSARTSCDFSGGGAHGVERLGHRAIVTRAQSRWARCNDRPPRLRIAILAGTRVRSRGTFSRRSNKTS